MPFYPSVIGWLILLSIVFLWVQLKLVKWGLNTGKPEIWRGMVTEDGKYIPGNAQEITDLFKLLLFLVVFVHFAPSIGGLIISMGEWVFRLV